MGFRASKHSEKHGLRQTMTSLPQKVLGLTLALGCLKTADIFEDQRKFFRNTSIQDQVPENWPNCDLWQVRNDAALAVLAL